MAEIILLPEKEKEELTVVKDTLGLKFSDIAKQAKEIEEKCVDYITMPDLAGLSARFDDNLHFYFHTSEGEKVKTEMRRFALSQLCTKLGIPVRYIERCLTEGRIDLAQRNFNDWLSDYPKNMLIRLYNDRVRGVLSERYSPFDTSSIIDVISGELSDDEYLIKGVLLNPERFHLRLTQRTMMNIPGEDIYGGITIDSSDVGRSTLIVRMFLYKQVCTNGLAFSCEDSVLFSQKHIGIEKDEFQNGVREAIAKLPDTLLQFENLIRIAKHTSLDEGQMKMSVEDVRKALTMTEDTANKVLEIANTRYGQNYWGVANALTEIAQNYSLERRLEIERYAGDYLLNRVA